ncbi:Uma2 family endonuclease [Gemmata sp.]|uniref:Uma2 family endonuclease n=1 Tax=Gemmata sp. TaxID=1914242 RepID=UPI003F7000A3
MTTPAVGAAKTLMTVGEFWEFVNRPENMDRLFELRRGEVVEMSRPKKPHGIVAANIARVLGNYSFAVNLGYVLSNDTGVVLEETPGTVVGPDVAYCVDANNYDDVEPKWVESPPVLAVEVLSPTDKPREVNEKISEYLRAGVKVVWLADPEVKTVTVYRTNHHHVILKPDDELTGGDALPGFSCKVADFFRLPGDRPPAPPQPPTP